MTTRIRRASRHGTCLTSLWNTTTYFTGIAFDGALTTVINITNKEALYNFLSAFSGTHFVSLRTVTGELGFYF